MLKTYTHLLKKTDEKLMEIIDNFKNQEEVLFARGLSYMVKSAKIENNKIVLEVEVLPNE